MTRQIGSLRIGFATLMVAGAVLLTATVAFGAQYVGNNSYTKHRLPWQHGQVQYVSQGYGQGNHANWVGAYYSLDFTLNTGVPVLGITQGSSCQVLEPNGSGLGRYVVQTAAPLSGSGTDWFFYGHLSNSWLPVCGQANTTVYQGQIAGWSGCTGNCGGPHVHVTRQNPGATCYCGSTPVSQPFPALSGISFTGHTGYQHTYVSDSVMPGDNNTVPQPTWYAAIFNNWNSQGGLNTVGSPIDRGGGPGVHSWGSGMAQDFAEANSPWFGIVMLRSGTSTAYWVHGAIEDAYRWQYGGATGFLGYPTSNEFQWGSYRRSNFVGGAICWSASTWTFLC